MRHERASKRLSEYLDGTLPSWQREALAEHLAACPECRRELRELRRTVQLLRRLEPDEPPEGLAARVTARVMAEMPRPWSVRLREALSSGGWGAPLVTAGAGLALLALVQNVEVDVHLPSWATIGTESPAGAVESEGVMPAPEPVATPTRELPASQPLEALRNVASPMAELPPIGSCWSDPAREGCVQWHSYLVGLAMHDPPSFLHEVEEVPTPSRDRLLGEVSRFAASSGAAPLVAASLQQAGDPRAAAMAPRFERIAAGMHR